MGIKHPVAFGVLLMVVFLCFAYAFSESERIVVSDGKLVIIESKWWGHKVERTEIPTKDITCVKLVMGGVRHSSSSLELQGTGNRVLKRLSDYGRAVSGYQIGLMEAIRYRPGSTFDRKRLVNLSIIFLGVFLLMPMAIACNGLEIAQAVKNKDNGDA